MHLLRDVIIKACELHRDVANDIFKSGLAEFHPTIQETAKVKGMTPATMWGAFKDSMLDFFATWGIASEAQTIVLEADLALSLRDSLERFADQPSIELPFDAMIIQFDKPIGENQFFLHERDHWLDAEDNIEALIIGEYNDSLNAIAWFSSGEIQRVKWLRSQMDFSQFMPLDSNRDLERALHNKKQLQLLAIAICMYMNCANVELEKKVTPKNVNAKRVKKGKQTLPDHYRCVISKTKYVGFQPTVEEEMLIRTGRHVSFMFAVRGHFRKLSNGLIIWINAHFRGIQHSLKSKVYQVKP